MSSSPSAVRTGLRSLFAAMAIPPPSFSLRTFSYIIKSSIYSWLVWEHFVSCIVQTEAFDCLIIFSHVGHFERAPAGFTPAKTNTLEKFFGLALFPLLTLSFFDLNNLFFAKNGNVSFLCVSLIMEFPVIPLEPENPAQYNHSHVETNTLFFYTPQKLL